jgi:biopolymer transport protein ExbD
MTPMIDVVFLLLVFFLATSSFQRPEKQLPSASAASPDEADSGNQPSAEPPAGLTDLSDVIVRIFRRDADSQAVGYTINREGVASVEELTQRLQAMLKIRADIPLVIDPENNVPAGEAIRVYDIARSNGSVAVFLVAR